MMKRLLLLLLTLPLLAGADLVQKDTPALLAEADAAYDRKDYAKALKIVQPLAEAGNAVAQFRLGYLYTQGQGVKQDYALARELYEQAAAQGKAGAQYNLGYL